ncbi:13647_t:CDS:2 [Ambispora gerdemannii]|uniref:13647_t:CDS:1 n=1 Tax=Ambispora gerdemannii TaxID=144530 RepID=A0A9N9B4V5_9GLOM|nr:13647_t:CDS:2 [Ambispora gerdemannii]
MSGAYSPEELNAEPGVLIDNKIITFDSYDFSNTHALTLDLSKDLTTSTPEFTDIDQRSDYSSTFKESKIYYIGGTSRNNGVADIRQVN